jgi:hypothetical protein
VGSLCLQRVCNLYCTLINVPKLLPGSTVQCPVFIPGMNYSTLLLPPALCGCTKVHPQYSGLVLTSIQQLW